MASLSDRCTEIQQSITEAGFADQVTIDCTESHADLYSDTFPEHDVMNGITATNEQVAVPAPDFSAPIPLAPIMAYAATTMDAALGIAVNGVPIYDYSAGGELVIDSDGTSTYDSNLDTLVQGQLDNCGGHSGRGDDYHYHVTPSCMIDVMDNKDDNPIIGWAYDGYPIYGDNNPDGTTIEIGVLDPCNGQSDDQFGYRYHTSDAQPYILKCLKGEVDTASLPRVGTARIGGAPIDVTSLTHADQDNGDGTNTRLLSYTYQAVEYYIEYTTRSDSTRCFDYKSKMCNQGQNGCDEIEQDACYCRELLEGEAAPSDCQAPGEPRQ